MDLIRLGRRRPSTKPGNASCLAGRVGTRSSISPFRRGSRRWRARAPEPRAPVAGRTRAAPTLSEYRRQAVGYPGMRFSLGVIWRDRILAPIVPAVTRLRDRIARTRAPRLRGYK